MLSRIQNQKPLVSVINLTSSKHVGDNANIFGISKVLQSMASKLNSSFNVEIMSHIDVDNLALNELQQVINTHKSNLLIILGAGKHGLQVFDSLNKADRVLFIASIHQPYHQLINQIAYKLDLLAMPRSSIFDNNALKDKLVTTKGVAHNLTKEHLISEYLRTEKGFKAICNNKQPVIFFMGGDAPDESGNYKLYSVEQARSHAQSLIKNHPGSKLIIINCNRTGMIDYMTQKPYSDNHQFLSKMDLVTIAFRDELIKNGLNDSDFHIIDFKTQSLETINRDSLLGLAYVQKCPIYINGDSTTNMTIACNSIDASNLKLYQTESMNVNHESVYNELNKSLEQNTKLQNPAYDIVKQMIPDIEKQLSLTSKHR